MTSQLDRDAFNQARKFGYVVYQWQ